MLVASDTSHDESSVDLVQNQAHHHLLGAALDLAPCEVLLVLQVPSALLSLQPVSAELLSPELQSCELATWRVEVGCRERLLHLDQRRRRLCVSALLPTQAAHSQSDGEGT